MNFKRILVTIFVYIFLIPNGLGEKILFYHPVSTYSHRISIWPLVQKLVAKGHQVTFISPFPSKTPLPNVTEIVPEPMSSFVIQYLHGDLDISRRIDGTMDLMQDNSPIVATLSCGMLFESPDIQKWLASNPHYDLVVVDWFMSDCGFGLAYKFKAKTMYYAASLLTPLYFELFGIVPDTASVPEFEYHFSPPMTFYERFITTIQPLIWTHKMSVSHNEITTTIRDKLNVPDMPNIQDLAKNASLFLLGEYVLDGYPQALTPNFVRVGGMHCTDKANPLPKHLAEFIKGSQEGFVYISLGSSVNPNNLSKQFQDVFFNTIKKLSHIQFIWKWSDSTRTELPKNLHIGEWFPQQDILGHPKLLAFVTQGGRPSIQESLFHGAPVLGIPVFADQDINLERLRDLGGAIVLQLESLTESSFQNAVTDMSISKKYKARMAQLSKLFHDRPMKPVDTALWWTEYVLRNDNTDHLKSLSANLTWYKRRSLDVWGAIFSGIIASITLLAHTIKTLLSFYTGNNKVKRE